MSRNLLWFPIAWGAVWLLLRHEDEYASPIVQAILSFVRAGIIVGGLTVAVKCNFTPQWKHSHPGYWLCVVGTWEQVEMMYINYRLSAQAEGSDPTANLWSTLEAVALLRLGILYTLGVAINRWPLYWRRTFYCLAVTSFANALWLAVISFENGMNYFGFMIGKWLLPLIKGVTFGLAMMAIYADIKQGVLRDWLHWLGLIYIGENLYYFVRSCLDSFAFDSTNAWEPLLE